LTAACELENVVLRSLAMLSPLHPGQFWRAALIFAIIVNAH